MADDGGNEALGPQETMIGGRTVVKPPEQVEAAQAQAYKDIVAAREQEKAIYNLGRVQADFMGRAKDVSGVETSSLHPADKGMDTPWNKRRYMVMAVSQNGELKAAYPVVDGDRGIAVDLRLLTASGRVFDINDETGMIQTVSQPDRGKRQIGLGADLETDIPVDESGHVKVSETAAESGVSVQMLTLDANSNLDQMKKVTNAMTAALSQQSARNVVAEVRKAQDSVATGILSQLGNKVAPRR